MSLRDGARALLGDAGAPLTILCLGAHCDDVEIGCGGTLLRLLAEHPGSTVRFAALASTPAREAETRAAAGELLAGAARADITVETFRDGYFPYEGAAIKDFFEATKRACKPICIASAAPRTARRLAPSSCGATSTSVSRRPRRRPCCIMPSAEDIAACRQKL